MAEANPPTETDKPVTPTSNNLRLRAISAVVLIALALGTAWLGGPVFLIAWTMAAVAVWWEWTGIVVSDPRPLAVAVGTITLIGMAAALAMQAPAIAAVCAVVGSGIAVASVYPRRIWALAGIFYAAAALLPAVVLRGDAAFGLIAILWLFAVVWAEDTGAYFAGRAIGGPKLAVRISPNKTWSGAVGGTLAGMAAGSAVVAAAGIVWKPIHLLVAFVVVVAAQIGDLLESAVKRHFGVKDASKLIPGHGGMMDRIDAFLLAAVIALLIGLLRGGAEAPARGLLVW